MQTSDSHLIHRRLFIVLLIVYTFLYLLFFFYGIVSFPAKYLLPVFRAKWTLNNAALRFFSVLTTIHCSTIILTISFSARSTYTGDLNRAIGGTLIIFLVFTFIYAVCVEGIEPYSVRRIAQFRYQTDVSRVVLQRAQSAYKEGRYAESHGLLEYYRTVDPGNTEAAELFGHVVQRLAENRSSGEEVRTERRSARMSEHSPAELIQLAEGYLEAEDVFSAYYYAQLAKEVASENGETWMKANRIAAVAASRIDALELSEYEREEAELYATKQRGIEALSSRDPERTIEGYYIFSMLAAEYPDDPEVMRYFGIASNAAKAISFFIDDAEAIVPMPGNRNIVFINSAGDSDFYEVVKLGKLAQIDSQIFVEDIDVLGIDRYGELRYQYHAPFAEYVVGTLLLQGIGRSDPNRTTGPVFYKGDAQGSRGSILALRPPLDDLLKLSIGATDYGDRGFFQLMELSSILPRYGYHNAPAVASTLNRIAAPFTFFLLSIFSVYLGIRFAPKGRPPIATYIFIPLIPIVVYGLIQIYQYGMRLFHAFLALSVGMNLSMALIIAAQLGLLIIAIFYLASTHAKLNDE